ncbi:MAG: GFA family protein [Rhizomicrobium sp.]
MATRTATCSCGQLRVTCEGEPVRISMCHCLACQKRSGAPFAVQARWPRARVTFEGTATIYVRTGDSGSTANFHFCPTCGSTVHYDMPQMPDVVAVAVGAFADPKFPPPTVSVYEIRRHDWVCVPPDAEHHD